jgi:alginate O-acetyltransferase complex protein AlgI
VSYDTLYFAIFLAAVWVAFKLLPWRGWILLAASIAFYFPAGPRDTLLAAILIVVNYAFQFPIVRNRRWLYPALIVNFGCLAYFKYRVFLATSAGLDVFTSAIVIPLGISFYIFQLAAFLIDLSRSRARPFYSLTQFALFILFFAQLVAGPIMRWRQFGPAVQRLFEGQSRRLRLLGLGLGLCLVGLVKKIVLADPLAPYVDEIFRQGPADAATAWLGAWLFSFQIYFDFSGYSDIALGLGYLFGLRLAVNFRQPFLARTPQMLWQHWHITLTRWLRDYLFMPLARQFRTRAGQSAALVATMTLAGLWHGPNWTFVIWGLGWGAVLLLWQSGNRALARLGAAQTLLTFAIWLVLACVFRSADVSSAMLYVGTMFGAGGAGTARVPADGAGGLLVIAGCLGLYALHWLEAQLHTRRTLLLLRRFDGPFLRALLIGLAVWLLLIPKTQDAPFIYFRF